MVKRGDKIGHIQYMYKRTNEYFFILFSVLLCEKSIKEKLLACDLSLLP